MRASILRWSLLALAASPTLVAAQGNVLIVGPGERIQPAVQAAQDGDTILVRGPQQHPFSVDIAGKALTLASDPPLEFDRFELTVRDLPAGKTVVLSGLNLFAPLLQNNAGHVRLVRCTAYGSEAFYYFGDPGLRVSNSSGSTALASSNVVGGRGYCVFDLFGFDGIAGLDVSNALAAVFDSTITGGEGGETWGARCGRGGVGASLAGGSARLLLANSTVQGGRGGEVHACAYTRPSGAGGNGLEAGAGATTSRQATIFAGGMGGAAPACVPNGAQGAPIVGPGIVHTNPTAGLGLSAPTIARE